MTTNGLCECGCGQTTKIIRHSDKSRGYVAGEHLRFVANHARTKKHAAPEGTKWCNGCETFLPVENFYKAPTHADGLASRCKPCFGKAQREFVLKRKYGITQKDVDAMHRAQKGRCAICRKKPERSLHVDHDADTGRVRGLLCGPCNQAIGLLQHKPKILKAAIKYLT